MWQFFLIAATFSWGIWFAFAASQAGAIPLALPAELAWLGEYGPAMAAVLLLARQGGGLR